MRGLVLALFASLVVLGAASRDLYDVLKVDRSADEATIKRAYRKAAVRLHPDKVQGTDEEKKKAAEKFQELSHAYEVLSNPEKRRIYDRFGEEGLKQAGQGGGHSAQDIFSQFFGGGFGFGGMQEEEPPRGDDIYSELEISLKDLYLGGHFRVIRDKGVLRPAPGKRQCNCRQKVVTRQLGQGMFQQFTTRECEECENVKLERQSEALTVAVDPGMEDGQQIVFYEEGEPLVDGTAGDLVFILRQQPHERFTRRGHDLVVEESISLVEALLGFKHEIEHLDGHKVQVAQTGVTRPGEWHTIRGEGMPIANADGDRRGDLLVRFNVGFPTHMTEKQKQQLKSMFAEGTQWVPHDEL